MANNIVFHDYSISVKNAMGNRIEAALEECAGELESQVKRNSRVDTGKTKNSFRHVIKGSFDSGDLKAIIGSSDENAIWEEFGTGEHALNGNGRKGGWFYVDAKGEGHYTHGKRPSRAFWKAFEALKKPIVDYLQNALKGL